MDTCTSIKVLKGFEHKIFSNPSGVVTDDKKYSVMIGSLLYLTASHPDIVFSKC